jgi:hypothetical protein
VGELKGVGLVKRIVLFSVFCLLLLNGVWGKPFFSGFMNSNFTSFEITSAAYKSYETSFDPTNSSQTCQNLDPEFELVAKTFSLGNTATVFLGQEFPKALCGVSSTAVYSRGSNGVVFPDYLIGNTRIQAGNCGFTACVTSIAYNIVGMRAYAFSGSAIPVVGANCEIHLLPNAVVAGIVSNLSGNAFDCVLNSVLVVPAGTNTWENLSVRIGANGFGGLELILEQPLSNQLTVSFAVPRKVVPEAAHLRLFSCPLEAGRFLHIRTFENGEIVSLGRFGYPVNYFCSQHEVIVTQLATQRTTTTTDYYSKLLRGESYVVPQGETHTYFYVPLSTTPADSKCLNGDVYDEVQGACIRIVSGVVYECADKTATLENGLCVKQGVLEILCPEGTTKIGSNCYFSPAGQCPEGTELVAGKCVFTDVYCQVGYLWDAVTKQCYKEGVVVCPIGTQRVGSDCLKTDFECPTGTYKFGAGCFKEGQIVCPTGTSKVGETCLKDDFVCPTGTTRFENACLKQGEFFCPIGYHLNGVNCYPDQISCPIGTSKIGELCVYNSITLVCPTGTVPVGDNRCYPESEVECPLGSVWSGNGCLGIVVCGEGTHKVESACVKDSIDCPVNSTLVNGKCIGEINCPLNAPEGSHLENGVCVAPMVLTCLPPNELVSDSCRAPVIASFSEDEGVPVVLPPVVQPKGIPIEWIVIIVIACVLGVIGFFKLRK